MTLYLKLYKCAAYSELSSNKITFSVIYLKQKYFYHFESILGFCIRIYFMARVTEKHPFHQSKNNLIKPDLFLDTTCVAADF